MDDLMSKGGRSAIAATACLTTLGQMLGYKFEQRTDTTNGKTTGVTIFISRESYLGCNTYNAEDYPLDTIPADNEEFEVYAAFRATVRALKAYAPEVLSLARAAAAEITSA